MWPVTTTARASEAAVLRRQVKSSTQEDLTKAQRSTREDDLEKKLTPVELTWTDDHDAVMTERQKLTLS